MTREEASFILANIDRSVYDELDNEALDMAIKALEQEPCNDWYDVPSDEMTLEQARQAVKDLRKKLAEYLEQEPCEDCISREAVLDYIEGSEAELGHSSENELVCQDIKEFPPVTPQPKIGRWIRVDKDKCKCDQCEVISFIAMYPNGDINYCPNCGAKMQEGEE